MSLARVSLIVATVLFIAACSSMSMSGPRAEAKMEARSGSAVAGTVSFSQSGDKLVVEARVSGLTSGEHGFHIHESGDCSAADATSAKGHFNPGGMAHGYHGGMERHAGDMPNLVADSYGNASFKSEVAMLTLGSDPSSIMGRSVVIHADPDDFKSQPAGNSGKRIACGTIRPL